MRSTLIYICVLASLALGGCSERPLRADPERVRSYNAEAGPSPMRERTLMQDESL
jgi:hypothetical protein